MSPKFKRRLLLVITCMCVHKYEVGSKYPYPDKKVNGYERQWRLNVKCPRLINWPNSVMQYSKINSHFDVIHSIIKAVRCLITPHNMQYIQFEISENTKRKNSVIRLALCAGTRAVGVATDIVQ